MIDKFVPDVAAALAGIADGAVVLLPGFGNGMPETLLNGLIASGARDLTLVVNSGGRDTGGTADILATGQCRKLICSFVRADSVAGRLLAEGRETRVINGRNCLLEYPIAGDVALIDAWEADRWGNLTHRESARNFNPVMAMAATLTIAQTKHVVPLGDIPPANVHTPGVFVHRVLHVPA